MISVLALAVWVASAQAANRPPAPKPTPRTTKSVAADAAEKESAAELVEQARAARTKGDSRAALRLLDQAIEKQPTLREAAALKIDVTAASGDLADALAAYDRYVAASEGRGDRSLLPPIAKAALRDLRGNELGEVRATALAALAGSGDSAAKKELERAAASKETASTVSVDAALARIGDEAAAARFADRIRQGSLPARMSALEATREFSTAPPALTRALVAALGDKDLPVRAAAAQAAGRLKITDAQAALRRALAEPGSYLVRLSAAVALHRLGDPTGDDLLRQALAGDLAEAKVFAASAFTAAESGVWRPSVETVLATSTGIDALTAAEVLLALDSEAARRAVDQLASDPNPSIRSRAARVAGTQRGASASTVRRLLEDQSPIVRLYVAEGLLQSERPATLKR